MKKNIRKTAFSAIFTALSTVLIVIGGLFDILDLTVAAASSFIICIAMLEIKGKYPLLIYFATSVLCAFIMPMTTATIYYIALFGYYPILRVYLKRLGKWSSRLLGLSIFNAAMIILVTVFRTVFAMQNEPKLMYVILFVSANIFYFVYDYAIDVFAFIYVKKLKKIFKIKL